MSESILQVRAKLWYTFDRTSLSRQGDYSLGVKKEQKRKPNRSKT